MVTGAYDEASTLGSQLPPFVPARGKWPPRHGWNTDNLAVSLDSNAGSASWMNSTYLGVHSSAQRDPIPIWAALQPNAWRASVIPGPWQGQLQQDRWVIEHVYPGKRGGFFFEAGAVDGRELSNTIVLEREYGWRGVLVEGRRDVEQNLRAARPNSQVFIALLGDTEGERQVLYSAFESRDLSNTTAFFVPEAKAGPAGTKSADGNFVSTGEVYTTRTLGPLLDAANAPKFIDYFSLDIEGFELETLRDFPFDKYTFGALSIEDERDSKVGSFEYAQLSRILLKNGYVRERQHFQDSLWLHSSVAEAMYAREQEMKRRRRGRARRADFAGGIDWASMPEYYKLGRWQEKAGV